MLLQVELQLTFYEYVFLILFMYRHNLYNDKEYISLIRHFSEVFLNIAANNDLSILVVGKPARTVFPRYDGGIHPSAVLGRNCVSGTYDDLMQASNNAYNRFYRGVTGNTDLITPFSRYVKFHVFMHSMYLVLLVVKLYHLTHTFIHMMKK